MGLDIIIRTDKNDQVFTEEYYTHDLQKKHSLSRNFCYLMCRQNVVSGEPELDQIGRLASVNISPIYAMETYGFDTNEELDFFLQMASNEEERKQIIEEANQKKAKLKGNLDEVLSIINALIEKLSAIEHLPKLLNILEPDTLQGQIYFIDFNLDKGDSYLGNNFGQDLRNFKRFLEFAKEKGATTVYFLYG